ncbi:glycerophosphodiester phosphodiesterase [Microbacterium lushaniae]|uniref:Glycerophosphodiester phosphodiesterase n=1 Tax=Microbacterium lushaniae TaxID=2614639 RepID=A0A5J6L3B3_9MICO|nr:glycerophosphodiester phosphodiesterase [Microbacterium lushaniae]
MTATDRTVRAGGSSPARPNDRKREENVKIRAIAHRGYSAKYPENTVTALKAAVDLNYSHVEFDVQLSKDGVPVLMHDYNVDRITDASGAVRDFTLAELQSFEIAGGERIATLEEALDIVKGKITPMVELKQAGDLYPGLEEKSLDLIRQSGIGDDCIIISFDHFCIERLRTLDADIPLGLTSSCAMPYVFDFMAEMRCDLLGVPVKMLTARYDRMITERGYIVGPWVVDSLADMQLIAEKYPHTLITTNELERWADFYLAHPELHQDAGK